MQVTLSVPAPEDAAEFIAAVRGSRSLHRPWLNPPDNPERYAGYLQRAGRDDQAAYLIRHAECGGLAGYVNINNIIRGAFQSGFLGYGAFASHAGRGLMTDGLRAVIAAAFGELGLHRLEANIQPENAASLALVRRLGFRREGRSPQYLLVDGEWRDHERWALLAGQPAWAGRMRHAWLMADRGRTPDSALVHAGTLRETGQPVVAPPMLTSVLVSSGQPRAGDYGRGGNPSWAALEQALGQIEDADAILFGSGQAAAMALMLALSRGRDKILLPQDGYYNARALAGRLQPHGARPVLFDQQDLLSVERELGAGIAVLWAESPTNPLLRVADLAALGRLAAAAGAPMVVDNTVATGLLQQPLELGASAALCSLTKSASGHSDVILGAVTTRDPILADELRNWRTLGGGIAGPMEAWLATRGLKTLPLRTERQSANALAIARHLVTHPRVLAVHYPGLAGPSLALAQAQMPRGFGPLLSFELDGTAADADAVIAAAALIVPASSFGGVESTWERRGRWPGESAPGSLIRMSAGVEPAGDLIADIAAALGRPSR